jgi:hypothetical protein
MFKLVNRWTDFDEIWYGRYAVGGQEKLVLLIFFTVGNNSLAVAQNSEVRATFIKGS